jgi:hypothetical protein
MEIGGAIQLEPIIGEDIETRNFKVLNVLNIRQSNFGVRIAAILSDNGLRAPTHDFADDGYSTSSPMLMLASAHSHNKPQKGAGYTLP